MKKHLLRLSIIVLFFGAMTIKSHAQIAAWDFTGQNQLDTSKANLSDDNLVVPILRRGAGAPASAGANSFRTTSFQKGAIPSITNAYFQFTLTAKPGGFLFLSTINATFAGTATYFATPGVTSQFAYSLDGTTFTLIGSPVQSTSLTMAQIDLTGITQLQNLPASTTVTFRYYASGQTTTGGWGFNSPSAGTYGLAIGGTVYNPTAPNITLSTNSLNFSPTATSTSSAALSYTVKGANLTEPIEITAPGPFTISDAINGTYASSLTLAPADIATEKTIFVKFSPITPATFSGTITVSSLGATSKKVLLSGDGIDPANLSFNFDNCATLGVPGLGFISYSVTGPQKWACSNFGRNSSKGVDINGTGQENEDWLISPPLTFGSLDLPILRFWSRGEFTGPSLQLLVSTDYDGTSDPNSATWTDLQANFPPLTNVWTMTDGIDLSAYKGFSKVYIAFKYISSPDLGAARWTLDDVDVTNRTQLLSTSPLLLNFDEVAVGGHSAGIKFLAKALGYGDITLTAPSGYELSADGTTYSASVVLNETALQAGTNVFARFSPTDKQLKIEGKVKFTATGLDSSLVTLTGSSYPKSETFDAGCYNLSFFGSNSTNNPTQEKIDLQVDNIATVMTKLDMDILGIEEVSNDVALASLVAKLPHHSAVISERWSYSFNPPSPDFPPQKTGFIYDNTTTTLISSRDMFVDLYDKARTTNPLLLPDYPLGTPSSFWGSGRLPFMATFDVTIQGKTKRIVMVDVHAKSGSDSASYNRRVYDAKVLYDSLKAYYSNDNVVLVGDYNDRVFGSITAGSPAPVSPYKPFVGDNTNFSVLTYPLDVAGRVSFLTGSGLIDHISVTKPLTPYYIANSTDIEDPRSYIPSYNATTASDHMPVYSRFNFSVVLPVTLTNFNAQPKGKQVLVTWSTSTEYNSNYFVVERSVNSKDFTPLGVVKSAGNSNVINNYQLTDSLPLSGVNYYRLKQVDIDGTVKYSMIVAVSFGADAKNALALYPNPVSNHVQINLNSTARNYVGKVIASDGKVIMNAGGDISQINQQINQNLYKFKPGVYVLKISNATDEYSVKFIKQ